MFSRRKAINSKTTYEPAPASSRVWRFPEARLRHTKLRLRAPVASSMTVAMMALMGLPTASAAMSPQSANIHSGSACSASATHVTLWDWDPGLQSVVNLFNSSHPSICVVLQNVGAGSVEYDKLEAALKAGSGAPDMADIGYSDMPFFIVTGHLKNLAPYGINSVKKQFVSWAWSEFSQTNKVYGIPTNTGPMGLMYNKDFFRKYHITVPTTWTQFAADAAKVHRENPKAYLTDFAPNESEWFDALIWQAGARPFTTSGTHLTINFESTVTNKVAQYWQKLIDQHVVEEIPDLTNEFFTQLGNGTLGAWLSPAWAPDDFTGTAAKATLGQWRIASMPQWATHDHASANWGSGGIAVTDQSHNPVADVTFLKWIATSTASWHLLVKPPLDLFPVTTPILGDNFVLNTTIPLTGPQELERVFAQSASQVNPSFQWSPFQPYVDAEMADDFAPSSGSTLVKALGELQHQLVQYATSQGFKVSQ